MDVKVKGGELSEKEIQAYVNYVEQKYLHKQIVSLEIDVDGDFVNLKWETKPQNFNRIRRITGYLVGNMSHWNDAKTSEERDRVKHI